jgi:hypothetical protein
MLGWGLNIPIGTDLLAFAGVERFGLARWRWRS